MSRALWFAAGAASGVYALVKVKRTAENFTPDGIGARVAAAKKGARVFADEVRTGMAEREADLLSELRAGAGAPRAIAAGRGGTPPAAPTSAPRREAVADGHR